MCRFQSMPCVVSSLNLLFNIPQSVVLWILILLWVRHLLLLLRWVPPLLRWVSPLLWWVSPLLWWVSPLLRWVPTLLLLLLRGGLAAAAALLRDGRLDGLHVVLHALLDAVVLGVGVTGAQLQLVQLLAQREEMQGTAMAQAVAHVAALDVGDFAEVLADEAAHARLQTRQCGGHVHKKK